MNLYFNNLNFFSKKGYSLNLNKEYKVFLIINSSTGSDGFLEPITDINGNLISINIINSGINYNPSDINIDVAFEDGTVSFNIPNSNITLDSNGSIVYITIPSTQPSNLPYPSFVYSGAVFLDRVSINLIENEHVFLIEEVFDNLNNIEYTYPRTSNLNTKIKVKWTNEFTEDVDKNTFFIFDIDNDNSTINIKDEIIFDLDDGTLDLINTNPLKRKVISENNKSIQINLACKSEVEGIFERVLNIIEFDSLNNKEYLLAEIIFRCEVIGEDDRFLTILDNLGQKISQNEEFIFRESDINENLPDYILLNRKRKEFILEHHNILPYLGSYKALINILNWLGYSDLRIKEYYLDTNEKSIYLNKYRPIDIKYNSINVINELLSKNYKKTNLFGLYYDLNKVTDDFDEFGLPIVKDSFLFTQEEVLIKLFALKNYLKQKFLPLNARIIDIVGEGFYFEVYKTKSWQDKISILNINLSRDIDFDCNPNESQIIDLRLLNDYDSFKPAVLKAYFIAPGQIGVNIIDGGYGYIGGNLYLEFIGGYPITPASGTVTIDSNGSVISVTLTNNGVGYVTLPDIIVKPEPYNPNKLTTILNSIKYNPLNFFENIKDTKKLIDSPNIEIGAPVVLSLETPYIAIDEIPGKIDDYYYGFRPAILEAIVVGGIVTSINIIDGGEGYLTTPTINLIGGSYTTPATIGTITIIGGSITSVTLSSGGSGYLYAPTVNISGGIPSTSIFTIDYIPFGDFYEVEWIVKGPRNFYYNKRGLIQDLKEHLIILPYIGNYDVEMILYDTDNNAQNRIKKSCVKVYIPDVRYNLFSSFIDKKIKSFVLNDLKDLKIEEIENDILIRLYGHDITIDAISELSFNDLDLMSYIDDNDENRYPTLLPKEILRVSETDRIFGNLIEINTSLNKIKVENPFNRPKIKPNENLYFRNGDNIFRSKVLSVNYGYPLKEINVLSSGIYEIEYDYNTNQYVSPNFRPQINISPPPTPGLTAMATPVMNCIIANINITNTGNYLNKAYDKTTNTIVNAVLFSGNYYRLVFSKSELTNTNDILIANINTSTYSVSSITGTYTANGYDQIPSYYLEDANGNIVIPDYTQTAASELKLQIKISGNINNIKIINPGSGYTTTPTISVINGNLISGITNLNPILDTQDLECDLILNNLPIGLNTNWEVLKEVGCSILIKNDHTSSLKPGQYLKIINTNSIPKIKYLNINSAILDSLTNQIIGIKINGNYTNQFIKGERLRIYKNRQLDYGTISNKFNHNVTNKLIKIFSPTFNVIDEIKSGYHIIKVHNLDINGNIIYTQRFLIDKIIQNGSDFELKVIELDGDINLINNSSIISGTITSKLEYDYYDFNSIIDDLNFNGIETEIYLNFNNWKENSNFIQSSINLGEWYFDYETLNGDYSLLVKTVGLEDGNTFVQVDDPDSELWMVSTGFKVSWRDFDEDYADAHFGLNIFNLDNFEELKLEDFENRFYIDDFTFNYYNYAGFKILDVAPSGEIKFNEFPNFIFQNITGSMTLSQRLNQAVIELNSSDNPGISQFTYSLYPDSINPSYIIAIAKDPGSEHLGYIQFINGVIGEYANVTLSHSYPLNFSNDPNWLNGYYGPFNKDNKWHPLMSAYREFGIDPGTGSPGWYPAASLPYIYSSTQKIEHSKRIPYLRSFCGRFALNEIVGSTDFLEVPIGSVVFINLSNCKIAGKTKFLFKLYDPNKNLLLECVKPYLIWFFTNYGEYDLEIEITDSNENKKSKYKKGVIKVV